MHYLFHALISLGVVIGYDVVKWYVWGREKQRGLDRKLAGKAERQARY